MNPELLSYYCDLTINQEPGEEAGKPTYQSLKELGVKLIRPKLRHKFLMSVPKAIGPLLDLVVPLLPLLLWLHPIGLPAGVAWLITSLFLLPTFYALSCRLNSAISQKTLTPDFPWLFQFGLKTQYTWAIFLKALWTGVKAVIHAPLKFALRVVILEVPFSLAMSLLILTTGLFYVGLSGMDKLLNNFNITSNISSPMKKIYDSLREINAALSAAVFRPLRYWIERQVGDLLRTCRDGLVRSVEQDMQRNLPVLESTAGMNRAMASSGQGLAELVSEPPVCFGRLFTPVSLPSSSNPVSFSIQQQLSEIRFKKKISSGRQRNKSISRQRLITSLAADQVTKSHKAVERNVYQEP